MGLKVFVGVIGGGLAAGALAQGVDLDRPVSRAPTARSEIRRGEADALKCLLSRRDPLDPLALAECVEGAERRALSDGAMSVEYRYGLLVQAVQQMGFELRYAEAAANIAVAREWRAVWAGEVREIKARAHLSVAAFCEAVSTHVEDCERLTVVPRD